jgi:transaldolase
MNPRVQAMLGHGQSPWLDHIDRRMLDDGTLAGMVGQGLRGVTSNPTIFAKAIESDAYDAQIGEVLAAEPEIEAPALFECLAVQDIRAAADILGPVHAATGGLDGYVSLEVSPHLAHRREQTIAQAQRLWALVDRPNLMVKVPATLEGLGAIEALTAVGINVNATLLFSVERLEAVIDAFLRGISRCDVPERVASVASLFVSRLDSSIDPGLERMGGDVAPGLRGKVAIANATRAYRAYRRRIETPEYADALRRGARVQRLLWGSTSSKNPAYPPLMYVEALIGRDTVDTMPLDTWLAFLHDGKATQSLALASGEDEVLSALAELGIDLAAVTAKLEADGVAAFERSYESLLGALQAKAACLRGASGPARTEGRTQAKE